jgi:hypothetical protein
MLTDVAIAENSAKVLKILKIQFSYDLVIPILSINANDQSRIFKKYLHNQVHYSIFHNTQ